MRFAKHWAPVSLFIWMAGSAIAKPPHYPPAPETAWPPMVGQPYPDIAGIDAAGHTVHLSAFKGKILLIEFVGMTHPVSIAWSGGRQVGRFAGVRAQREMEDFPSTVPRLARGLSVKDDRLMHIQLLLFGPQMQPTTEDDAKRWDLHFLKARGRKALVLAGGPWYLQPPRSQTSFKLIPGFHLVDQNYILRSDATGENSPKLFTELLPLVPALLPTQNGPEKPFISPVSKPPPNTPKK